MNTANIKKYAPQAREDFIAAITQQATKYGIYADRIEEVQRNGDVALIGDGVFPASIIQPREQLIQRIEAHGFEQTIDYIAYSWFNRLCAIRYLEVHDFLAHGRRVLSSADGSAGLPQILEDCLDIDLPGLSQERIAELKLAGNKDEELYRELLLAQCRRLHSAMPLLFEPLANDTELLLPDNLTKTDSLIRGLVRSVPEEDWANIEIIGWLYQFYISAKKDQVIGKVVKTEDIPAATQLFTPNWIVKYLVQNSVGRLWMMANPASSTKAEWEYYIQPAEQTEEVQQQLNALIQTRIDEDGIQLNPESITVLDPACGSGHILVEAYDCLKAMYLERGYRSRDIPRLILEKNLFGLDIDNRAAQLASFALLMKAREDDRSLLRNPPKLNIMALQETGDLDVTRLWNDLNLNAAWKKGSHEDLFGSEEQDLSSPENDERFKLIQEVLVKFENAKTFGSLICMDAPEKPYTDLKLELEKLLDTGDTLQKAAVKKLVPLLTQAMLLAKQYDAVIANPPYLGAKNMNANLRNFANQKHVDSKADMFSMFVERCLTFCSSIGNTAFVTPYVWMFISSYAEFRLKIIKESTLQSLIQLEYNAFEPACVPVCAFTISKFHIPDFVGSYIKLSDFKGHENQAPKTLEALRNPQCGWFYNAKPDDFQKIDGNPIAYWISENLRSVFDGASTIGEIAKPRQGLATSDNDRFLRLWFEPNLSRIGFNKKTSLLAKESGCKWFPYNKGGAFQKWYGNNSFIINWENDGEELLNFAASLYGSPTRTIKNIQFYFRESITWSALSSGGISLRYNSSGFLFDTKGQCIFADDKQKLMELMALLNSKVAYEMMSFLAPTLDFNSGVVAKVPVLPTNINLQNIEAIIKQAKINWDSYETSWDFSQNPIICTNQPTLEQAFNTWQQQNSDAVAEMKRLEEENNKLFIEAYGLQDELTPDVPDEQITLTRADREKDTQRLVSYAIGCMMGRYSLDESGLIYAHAGNEGFDPNRYKKFKADADGIIPLTEMGWFDKDEADYRIKEFLNAVWGKDTEAENMLWLAEGLAKKNNEIPEEAVRRYLATKFYKDHLQTYKKRPIYWLFSSGKLGAFQALVYLHRYNESTLARMRTEYVMPLISKMAAYAKTLEDSKEASSSAAETNRIEKQLLALHKQQAELSTFEEKLRHLADQRITLDLDDGVKVNYGKFGDLLAEVKAVTGEK